MSELAMLDHCRDMVAARLSDELAQILTRLVKELTEMAGNLPAQGMYALYMNSMELARDQGGNIALAFKKHFFRRFNEIKQRVRQETGLRELDISNLSLQDPDDLEISLAANSIANAIGNQCGEELFGLGKRMGVLLNEPELRLEQVPLGPEAIGTAVLDALKDQNSSVKIMLLLVTRINKQLPEKVRETYQAVNRHLVEQKILPTIRVGIQRAAPAPAPAPAAAASAVPSSGVPGAAPASGSSASSGLDIFAMLQQLLAAGSTGGASLAGMGMAGMPMPMPQLPIAPGLSAGDAAVMPAAMQTIDPELLRTLTQLQHGRLDGLAVGKLDANLIADGHINVLRELRNSQAATKMAQMEAMTLDIVVLVFDYILDDKRIPDAMKALIGRLQIPVLKVTMLDKSFFSQKAHPARRLLDLLAESAIGWDPQEGHESTLYKKITEIVQRVLNEFDDRLDVFAEALATFQAYLAQEKQLRDDLTCRSAQFLRSREQLDGARVVAHDAVTGSLLDQTVPPSIRKFLSTHWEHYLAQLHVEKGEGAAEWNDAVNAMNELIWSLTPKTDKVERRKLIDLLPRLLSRLDSGIRALGLDKSARDAFFSDLVQCHAIAVKAGFRGEQYASWMAEGSADTGAETETAPTIFSGTRDFEEIPLLSEAVEPDSALYREIAASLEESPDIEEITITGVHGEFLDEPRDSHFVSLVKNLKRGVWIEFKQEDGTSLRAKLAWISPRQGLYLFTNRLGQRAVSINAEGLADKFRDGRAQTIDDVPLIDRAVTKVFEHFKKSRLDKLGG